MAPTKRSGRAPQSSNPSKVASGSRSKGSNLSRNVSGYQKRQERKAKTRAQGSSASSGAAGLNDLYEYDAGKNRRAHVEMQLDPDEFAAESKSKRLLGDEDDGDEADERVEELRRKIAANVNGEFGVVESEDDEELDSDEAFEGESDEERFGNFKFAERKPTKSSSSQSKKARFGSNTVHEIDLNEDSASDQSSESEEDDDEDDDDADEGDPLSAMLDGAGDDAAEASSGSEEADSASDSEAEAEDSDEEMLAPSASASEAEGEDALEQLGTFIDGLPTSQKRKASETNDDDDGKSIPRKRKRRLVEQNEAGAESEFATRGGTDGKISLDDLLVPLANSKTSSLDKAARALSSSLPSAAALSAPLHTRAQERLDRSAAYEQTKTEVEKWAPAMKRIREAEHLSFPLQKPQITRPSTSGLSSTFQPSNDMESAVDRLLQSANLASSSSIEKTESLEMAHLTKEEVAARRAELRQMRELMFRADAKAKRIAKIKSKTYRKIQKKRKDNEALTAEELENLDPEAAGSERMKMEMERARERATLRHKNTGKWAQHMKGRGQDMDVDQRREMNEQLERGERLRRKIQGLDSDADEDAGDAGDASDDEDEDEDVRAIASRAANGVHFDEDSALPASGGGKKKGILEMKFMRDAAAREEQNARKDADDFKAEMLGLAGEAEDDDDVRPVDESNTDSITIQGNAGRMLFRPAANTSRSAVSKQPIPVPQPPESDASSVTLKSSSDDTTSHPQPQPSSSRRPLSSSAPSLSSVPESANPWLTVASSSSAKQSRKKNNVVLSRDSAADAKSQAALKKQLAKTSDVLEREADDAVVEIDLDPGAEVTLLRDEEPAMKGKSVVSKGGVDAAFEGAGDEDDDEDFGGKGKGKGKGKVPGGPAFKQRDLVALAFAGDNVVEEFNARKQREIEAAAPKEIDTTLPGWGAWGGKGTKKSNKPPKSFLVKKLPGIAPAARQDAGKAHLIISEKRDKKASKYLVKDLPHPYTSQAQFERSLSTPVGPEWNTRMSFQKGTLPKVVKKIGTIIDPIQQNF